jgi:integrase
LQVTNITPGVIRAMVTKLEGPEAAISSTPERPKGLGKGTRYGIMSFALAVLKAAFDDHVIATDVGATFRDENQDTRRGARKLRRVRAIERSEFDAMIAHAPMPMARDMAEALAFTGVRISELLALRVGDVLLGRTPDIKVERQWRRVNGGPAKLVGAKAGSDRRVRIDPKLVVTLAPYVEGRAADEWLFTEYDGKPWSYAQFMSRCWNPMINAARRAGAFYDARPVTPHDMRHSHASWLLSGGVPMEVVSERLGHRSIDMTIETYREFQKKDHDAVVAALRG